MIRYVVGDATEPQGPGPHIIAHIVNDVGAWGAGFTRALSRKWPSVERTYRRWASKGLSEQINPEEFRLGEIHICWANRGDDNWIAVAHMLAQHGVGTDQRRVDYEALAICLASLRKRAIEKQARLALPRIGCGLAGGDWSVIGPMIERRLDGIDVTVYDLPGAKP